jgi:hypothetical protein
LGAGCASVRSDPNQFNLVGVEPYGGAIKRYPLRASAFVHRDVSMDLFVDSFFDDPGKITPKNKTEQWLSDLMSAAAPSMNGHVYQNYPERDLVNYRWEYRGNAFNSLLQVKQTYDKNNFFLAGQPITPYPNISTIKRSTIRGQFPRIRIQ